MWIWITGTVLVLIGSWWGQRLIADDQDLEMVLSTDTLIEDKDILNGARRATKRRQRWARWVQAWR